MQKNRNLRGEMNRHPILSAPAAAAEEEDDVCMCSICFSAFSTSQDDGGVPRLLKCGHSFCTACLTRLLASSTPAPAPASAEAEQITCALRCPKCRTLTRVGLVDGEAAVAAAAGVKGLPRNFDLIDLLSSAARYHKQQPPLKCANCDSRPAEKFCKQCSGACLCVSCDAQLHSFPALRGHVRVASADAPAARAECEHHRVKKLEMWCETDGVAVCVVCLVAGPHKGHDAITIETAEQRVRERVELAHMEAAMGEVEAAVEREAEREAGEEESAREARAAIKRHFDRMREAVAQRQRALEAEVDKWERRRSKKAAKRRVRLAEAQTRLAAANQALQQEHEQRGGSDTSVAACQAARTAGAAAMAAVTGTQASNISFTSKDTWAQAVASSGRLEKPRVAGAAAEPTAGAAGAAAGAAAGGVLRNYAAMRAAQRTVSPGAQLTSPCGVAVDAPAGRIVVADLDSRQVHVWRADDGSGVRTFGTTLGLGSPWGVAVNHATGHILATDIDNHRVHVWRADDGSFVRTLGSHGSDPGQFLAPCGVAVDKEGQHVFVADSKNNRVQVWRADDGSFLRAFGSPGVGPAQFQHPAGVAVDAATGNVIVADWGNHRVQVWHPNGCFVRSFGSRGRGQGQFKHPVGVAVDAAGNVFVADRGNHRVQVWRADGSFLCSFGSPGGGPAQFKDPRGVAVDTATGHIIVADSGNHRIQVW